ncbi:MAG TPA: hypothetical protein PLK90_11085 [Clostridiales bacterium]|nr:hypothetical protein [Clostridiales bacterium]
MNNKKTAQVYHFDLYGTRDNKYEFLHNNSLKSVAWNVLKNEAPNYFLVKKDFTGSSEYVAGFSLSSLMNNLNPGVESGRDELFIDYNNEDLHNKIENLMHNKDSTVLATKYSIVNSDSFRFKTNLDRAIFDAKKMVGISYRPFDIRRAYYDIAILRRPSNDTFRHILKGSIGLVFKRGLSRTESAPVFVIKMLSDRRGWSCSGMQGAESISPLYLYPEKESKTASRTPNLNSEIVQKIADGLGLKFTNEKESDSGTFAPIDILDYIYAVLHSPTYREKYKEFLKIDFPRVPYPKDKETFCKLVRLGGELRQIHLLESPAVEKYITKYPVDGDNVVNKIKFQDGKVYINETQHFANVPEVAWSFFIGGYQPAQKWLKDRKGRKLEFDDILHYQKIIVALSETDRIMKEVDEVEVE